MTHVLHTGSARGGLVAMADALKLWAKCAEGGADYSVLPFNDASAFVRLRAAKAGFAAAIEVLTENWNAERVPEFQKKWSDDARETLTKAAGHLLAACKEVERSNQANAWFEKYDNVVNFYWEGTWTQGRTISVQVNFLSQTPEVYLEWKTGTGQESTYLSLPSMTDEADKPEGHRDGGWMRRGARTVRFA